jgi:hypothetical protein
MRVAVALKVSEAAVTRVISVGKNLEWPSRAGGGDAPRGPHESFGVRARRGGSWGAVTRAPFSVGGRQSFGAPPRRRATSVAARRQSPVCSRRGALGTGRGCASVAAGRGSHAWVPPSRLVVIGIVVRRDICVEVGGGELACGAGGG